MKKLYSSNWLTCIFVLALLAASTATSLAQTMVHVTPIQYGGGPNEFYPQPKNIAPGTNNNLIGVFGAYVNGPATVNSITVTTAGNYTVNDIKNNGFKLWYAPSMSASPTSVAQATLISTKAPVASGNTLVFSGLTQSLHEMGSYFYITADVAEAATLDRTIHLAPTPLSNIVLASGTLSGETLPASAVQTIGLPLPEISIWGYNENAYKISPGSTKNRLYSFQLNISEANDVLQSLTVPVRGTITTADVASNGFRLWYRTYFGNYEEVLAGSASLSSNGNVVFSNLNVPLIRDSQGYGGHEFTITVDMAAGATPGRTVGIAQFPLSNFNFERARNVMGSDPMSEGNLNTVAVPAIAISSLGPAAGVVSPGSVNSVLYKLRLRATDASASFSSIRFTTGGTYQTSDITRFKLYAGEENWFERDELIATTASVASGNQIVFNLTDATMQEGEDVVLYLVADIAPGAVAGRNIQIQAVTPANLAVVSGTITGTTTAGGVQTIAIPAVAFTPAGPPAGIISPGSLAVLHSVKVDVTGAPATFENATFQLSGTFQPSDLGDPYDQDGDGIDDGLDGFYLVYHKTANLLSEIEEENDDEIYLLSYTQTVPASGQSLAFSRPELDDDDFNPTIPLGTGYITVVAPVRQTAVLGRTIQVSTSGTAAYTLVSGTKSGTTGSGGEQTIGAASIAVSSVATPAGNISIGTEEAVLYRIKLDITQATAILNNLNLTTGGSYQEGDINSFRLYYSTDAVFNRSQDYYLSSVGTVPSGGTIEFEDMDYMQFRPGSSAYLFVVAQTSSSATAGRTINITATPASAFDFLAGNVTGSFPLPAGGSQTFAAPTLQVAVPAVPQLTLAGGTNSNLVHKFSIAATGADAYPQNITINTLGNFEFSDLTGDGFRLWYNTSDSFTGSRPVAAFGVQGSGSTMGTGMWDVSIKAGTTGYFFITADLAPAAEAGRTLQVEIEDLHFSAGQVTLPANAKSPVHTIGQPATAPVLAVNIPALTAANLQAGSADNVIYRFNVTASDASASPNFITLYTGGSYRNSDLAPNGLKLWYNTSNSFSGSTLVHTFANDGSDGYGLHAALANIQIAAGATGYFFVTASLAPGAGNNRTIRIDELYALQFASGSAELSGTRGTAFTISGAPLSLNLESDKNGTLVYPNPYRQQETLTIETNSAHPKLVTIFSATGKVVSTTEMTETTQLTLANLSKGLYLIQVQNLKDNKVEIKKLLVQ